MFFTQLGHRYKFPIVPLLGNRKSFWKLTIQPEVAIQAWKKQQSYVPRGVELHNCIGFHWAVCIRDNGGVRAVG